MTLTLILQLFSFFMFNVNALNNRDFNKKELTILRNNLPGNYLSLREYKKKPMEDTVVDFLFSKLYESNFEMYSKKAFGIICTTPDTSLLDTNFLIMILEKVDNIYFWDTYTNLSQRDKLFFIKKVVNNPFNTHKSGLFIYLLKKRDKFNYNYAYKYFKKLDTSYKR